MAAWPISAPNPHVPTACVPHVCPSIHPSIPLSLCPSVPLSPCLSIRPSIPISPIFPGLCFQYSLCPVSPCPSIPSYCVPQVPTSLFPLSPVPCVPISMCLPRPSISPYPAIPLSLCPPTLHVPLPSICPVSPYRCVTLSLVSICPCAPPFLISPRPCCPISLCPFCPHTGVPRAPVAPVPTRVAPFSPCPRGGQRGTPDRPPRCSTAAEPPAQGAQRSRRAALGCGTAALWPLGNEPNRGGGNPRTRNGDSTPGRRSAAGNGTEGAECEPSQVQSDEHGGYDGKGH